MYYHTGFLPITRKEIKKRAIRKRALKVLASMSLIVFFYIWLNNPDKPGFSENLMKNVTVEFGNTTALVPANTNLTQTESTLLFRKKQHENALPGNSELTENITKKNLPVSISPSKGETFEKTRLAIAAIDDGIDGNIDETIIDTTADSKTLSKNASLPTSNDFETSHPISKQSESKLMNNSDNTYNQDLETFLKQHSFNEKF